jgi:hypothetical protein
MRKRGRRSAASILSGPQASVLDRVARPRAPHDLNDEEVEVWASVVEALPADYLGNETLPLLSQYCRHVIQARRIAELIERATADPELRIRDYHRLLRIQAGETAAMTSVATKLRISPQSTRTHRGNVRSGLTGSRPWEA